MISITEVTFGTHYDTVTMEGQEIVITDGDGSSYVRIMVEDVPDLVAALMLLTTKEEG